ncbi:MAG: D-alanyl-D-alanine carboxypeptidase [Syntrophales bacterium]|nr:D-alanyl-D-alanine carboxypeptidase [Syntrophales bacterium]
MHHFVMRIAAFFITVVLFLPSCLFGANEKILPGEVLVVLGKPIYRYAKWGIHVVDIETNEILYSLNAGEFFHPASITKLFTAAAALEHLGGDYRVKTTVLGDGFLDRRGTFHGNLIIVPRGDVFLNGWKKMFGSNHGEGLSLPSGLKTIVLSLKSKGINRIVGNVLVDDRVFERRSIYSLLRPGVFLYTISPSSFEGNTKEPSRYLPIFFKRALTEEGIKVQLQEVGERSKRKKFSRKKEVLVEYESPPLREYLKVIIKYSHNPGADMIPMLLALEDGKRTFEEGIRRLTDVLLMARIDAMAVSFGDCSGISPANLLTPESVVKLLVFMNAHRETKAFKECLSVLGVDGTLQSVVGKESPIYGKLIGKTGTLKSFDVLNNTSLIKSKGVAGYITTVKGRNLALVIIVNNVHLPDAQDAPSSGLDDVGRDLIRIAEIIHAKN